MLRKSLLPSDCNREIEVVDILSNLDRLLEETLLDVLTDNGHFGPLRLVKAHLEHDVKGNDPKNQERTDRTATGVKALFSV